MDRRRAALLLYFVAVLLDSPGRRDPVEPHSHRRYPLARLL